jgi:hypothetical protein
MSVIKLEKIQLPKREVILRTEQPKEFKGVPKKYKYKVLEDGVLENYYESKMHM